MENTNIQETRNSGSPAEQYARRQKEILLEDFNLRALPEDLTWERLYQLRSITQFWPAEGNWREKLDDLASVIETVKKHTEEYPE